MQKIIFADNNLHIGGVQKAFISLLQAIEADFDITLVLFNHDGELLSEIPSSVKIVPAHGFCDLLGATQKQAQAKGFIRASLRACAALFSKLMGNSFPIQMTVGRKVRHEGYDYAISFMQFSPESLYFGGSNEYILNAVKAKTKISFVHCDYTKYGGNIRYARKQYERFDRIAVCSESCKKKFLSVMPELQDKTYAVRNCNCYDSIIADADTDTYIYEEGCVNIVTVARLSEEKELGRGIQAVAECIKQGISVKYHLIGDGPEKEKLEAYAAELGISDHVVFHGMQKNPYRFMKNADLFLLPSRHEAAPMVFDEARCLGLPVLTTDTCSAQEMIADTSAGWVCENSTEGVSNALVKILADAQTLPGMRSTMRNQTYDNSEAIRQFRDMLKGEQNK